MSYIAEFPRRPLRRCAPVTRLAWLAMALLAVSGLPALAAAPDGGFEAPSRPEIAAAAGLAAARSAPGSESTLVRIAQATPTKAAAQPGVKPVASGDSFALPADLVAQARVTQSYLIVTKAPPWLNLSLAQQVGDGVWLVSPQDAEAARMNVAAGASGEREIVLTIVDKNGAAVSDARLTLQVGGSAQAAAPAATTTAAAASANPAAAPAAPAAPAPATGGTSTAAAPAPPSSAKSWTDFIAGKKPAAPAAQEAKPAPAAGGQKPEAELIGLAKHLVRECTTCHSLYGEDNGIPLMIGLTKDRFLDTMDLYKIGKRDNPAMVSVAQSLSDEEMLALATYLARIKPPTQTAAVSTGVRSDATSVQAMRPPAARLEAGTAEAARIDRWVTRAREMLDRGDIAQARLLLQRGAELGHALATMALASTYDPNVLPWRPEMGPAAEPARARSLYQTAIQLGAGGEAERRLSELP